MWRGAVLFIARVICVLGVNFQEKFITALVDNYAYTGQTFQLRYFLSSDCIPVSGSYPLFFYTGNEGDVELYVDNTGFMLELAVNQSALLVFAEHRYYGKSLPFPSIRSSADLKYFSPHQALADYAYLLGFLLEEYNVSTVVAFGGSYGGMLASWIRIKYPHLVDGALAASAPDLHFSQITDPNLFAQMATLPFAIQSSICVENIRAGFQTLLTYTQSSQYFYQLSQIFQTCALISTTETAKLVLDWAVDGLTGLAMLNYPYAANYGTELPQWPVGFACSLISGDMAQTPVQKLTDLFLAANVYYNYSSTQPCTNLTSELEYNLPWLWSYVRCSTLIMPIGYTGVYDMFYPQPWDPSVFRSFCENRFGSIKSQPNYAYIMYGSTNVTGNTFIYLSNVIFSNGEIDPWQSGGVYGTINPAVTTIYIPLAAHHLDLRGTSKADSAAITAARVQEASIIQQWIATNRIDKEIGR